MSLTEGKHQRETKGLQAILKSCPWRYHIIGYVLSLDVFLGADTKKQSFVRVETLCITHAMLVYCLFVVLFAWRCLRFVVSLLCLKQRVLHTLKIVLRFGVKIFIALFLKSEELRWYKFSSMQIKSINTLFRIPFYTNTGLLEDRTWLQY